jgi:hypothetical protein
MLQSTEAKVLEVLNQGCLVHPAREDLTKHLKKNKHGKRGGYNAAG